AAYVRAVRGGQSESGTLDNLIINGDGTVSDSATDLMWQQDNPNNTMDWKDALSYCQNLDLAGYTDWRLPTIKELSSIFDYSRYAPAIDTNIFSNDMFDSYYWSSTTNSNYIFTAWEMHFSSEGGYRYYDKLSNTKYVRAVRNIQATPTEDFGSLKVSISPEEAVTAGAKWRIDSGDWHDSNETVFNIAVGTHTVSFKDITGWTTPASQTVTVENGKTATATATYLGAQVVSVLTPSSPNATVAAGESVKIFGSSGANHVTIESGATAKLINFPGSNTITIKGDSTNFKVSRSGAMVKFEGVDGTTAQGTIVQLPATKTEQTIIFNDVSAKLVIESGKVMFGTQVVTLNSEGIEGTKPQFSSPVPDTGITKCYNDTGDIPCPQEGEDFYGQDANYSINPMSYTKLDENGNDLPITATSWAMVRDNVTGLIWENKNSGDGTKDYTNPHDADNTYTWYDSNPATNGGYAGTAGNGTDTEDFIKALNDSSFGGHSDWLLPTIKELSTIVDYSILYPGPTININYFKDMISSFYWSSSTDRGSIYSAWGVNFNYGGDYDYVKTNYYYVMAVRDGKSAIGSLDNLIVNGNGTVTDSATGLMWQQDTSGNSITWKDALLYCQNLNLAGYSDWRLPTIKELRTIVDYSRPAPAIDINYFSDTFTSFYWSSSVYPDAVGRTAWGVDYYNGNDDKIAKLLNHYFRAVRGGQ
ncbi:MAG: DUF1566 domain-containing protein, partial [Desulfamplus sp.]|nr:DUF1566 domain-containing protein [Desulfamplus sp.]